MRLALRLTLLLPLLPCLPSFAQQPQRGTGYALLVSCEKYDERHLKPLQFTRNDIVGLQNILIESGFRADNIVALHEEQPHDLLPEGPKVRKHLKRVLAKVGEDDTLVVALSGHGVQFKGEAKSYFCPLDAELDDRETLIDLEEVYRLLAKCPSKKKLLLVDACRNDPRSSISKSARATLDLESVTRPQESEIPEGLVALFSCRAGQESLIDKELQHSVFMYHLMKGWHESAVNDRGQVALHDLVRYTTKETAKYAKARFRAEQQPEQKNHLGESWTLSHYEGEIRQLRADGQTAFHTVQFARDGRRVVAGTMGDVAAVHRNGGKVVDPNHRRPELLVWDTVSGRLLKRYTVRIPYS
jgi:uncharacterized caspase-like protein